MNKTALVITCALPLLLGGCAPATHEKADNEFRDYCNSISEKSTTWERMEAATSYTSPEDADFQKYWSDIVSTTSSYFIDITSGEFQDADSSDPAYSDFLKACKSVGVEVSSTIRFF